MAHRFLHTLVFSSVLALEGCSTSHSSLLEMPDGGMPDVPNRDAEPPAFDGGPPSVDAGPPPFDGGSPNVDAGTPDAGHDSGPPIDLRFCEPGWQTTKASYCRPLDMDDPASLLVCYSSFICEPVENDGGDLIEACREREEEDGGCLLQRAEWGGPVFVEVDP